MSVDFTACITVTDEQINSGNIPKIDWDAIPTVNVSNANASTLMSNLGFTHDEIREMFEYGTSITPLDLQSRILLFKLCPGLAIERATVREGNMVSFGADFEYIDSRLTEIYNVSVWCDANGYEVSIH